MRPTSGSSAWLPGRYGAGEQPQLPATIVVMPCSSSGASTSAWSGCGITQSLCECMSMKPGAITWPVQSMRRAVLASSSTPTAAMRPSAIATEAGKPSRPVPSSTVPCSRMRSKAMRRPSHAQTPWRNAHRPPRSFRSARLRARGSPLRRRDYNGGTGPATVPIPRRARDHARRSSSVPSWAGVASRAQLCECAQEVSAEHLLDGRRREGAFEHDLHEPRQLKTRAKVARWDDQPVPVTAERRSVLPRDLDDVRQMIDDRRGGAAGARGEEALLVDDADDPTRVGHRAELRVFDVPPVWSDACRARMAHHERLRLVLDRDRVEEAFATNVREVHEDAPLVQAPHVVLPHGGEAAV